MERDEAEIEAEMEGEIQDEFTNYTAPMLKEKLKVNSGSNAFIRAMRVTGDTTR